MNRSDFESQGKLENFDEDGVGEGDRNADLVD